MNEWAAVALVTGLGAVLVAVGAAIIGAITNRNGRILKLAQELSQAEARCDVSETTAHETAIVRDRALARVAALESQLETCQARIRQLKVERPIECGAAVVKGKSGKWFARAWPAATIDPRTGTLLGTLASLGQDNPDTLEESLRNMLVIRGPIERRETPGIDPERGKET